MEPNDAQKYGRGFTLTHGGQAVDGRGRRRSMIRTAKEIELDERMRQRFLRLDGADSRAIQEIKEGRQAPWRCNARRALELHATGKTTQEIKEVLVEEFAAWIDGLDRQLKPAA